MSREVKNQTQTSEYPVCVHVVCVCVCVCDCTTLTIKKAQAGGWMSKILVSAGKNFKIMMIICIKIRGKGRQKCMEQWRMSST